jgi:hypothetical protein
MQRLTRTLAMASALAFAGVLAGCGDDVSIAPDPAISLTPPSASLQVGQSATFSATVTGLSNKAVTWSTDNAAKATVDNAGKVTAVSAGSATITATASDPNVKASAIVTITAVNKGVTKVEISPNADILKIGEFRQLTANVTADPGVARTVTWTSSAAAVATVDASGKVTAVTNGSAVITATSTVDPSISGTMALTVRPTAPAQISIQKITTAGNLGAPVNFNAVVGQIDVTLNLNPGDQTVTKVEVLIDNVTACSQNLSVAESRQLSLAAVAPEGVEAIDVVCSINTAAFNATTGVPSYLNGVRNLTAKATIGGTQPGNIATPSQALTFVNPNTFILTQALTGTTAQATSAAGLLYRRGSLNVTALPVIYNAGQSIAVATVTFGSAACDANGTGARQRALTAPAAGSGAWTASFGVTTSSTVLIGTTVRNYEFNGTAGCLLSPTTTASGEVATMIATDNAGNTIFASALPANAAAAGIRLDNRAPGVPTFWANPNNRQNGWLNATVGLTGANNTASLTSNNWLVDGTADAGVGGYVRNLRVGLGTTTVNAALAATPSSTPTLPAPSAANTSYCAVISAQDLLGNESALPATDTDCAQLPALPAGPPSASSQLIATQFMPFGVDIAAPTIVLVDNPPVVTALNANQRLNGATIGNQFTVSVTDTGTVGNSGMLSGSAVRGTVNLRNATATAAATCFLGSYSATTGVCSAVSVNAAPPFPLVPTVTVGASATTGYYTYSAVAQDAAGNQSAAVSRVIAYDPAANVPALTSALFNTPLNGPTVAFNANASDNFDLQDVTYSLLYAGGLAGPIVYPAVALNTFNAATLVNSNVPAGITINGFLRQVENVTANGPVAVGGAFKPTQLNGVARDQANNSSAAVPTNIPAASVTTGVSYLAAPAANLVRSWAITTVATNVSDGNVVAPVTAANPLTVTLDADAFGPTATFAPPFTRVDFYVLNGGNLVQVASATTPSTVDDGSPFGRRHRYSVSWKPGTAFGLGAQQIYAIGVNANGDGLVTPANGLVTITNP